MDQGERKTWLGAAHKALAHIDPHTLSRAAQYAMTKADHPSKLVPMIAAEAERLMAGYRNPTPIVPVVWKAPPPETPEQAAERAEIGALMRGLVKKLEANAGPDAA